MTPSKCRKHPGYELHPGPEGVCSGRLVTRWPLGRQPLAPDRLSNPKEDGARG